ncbi:hypothetical protein TREES_T100008787 [Tupaia chinensis]|uniref:Uncharacterized protein n=1 Tax=Tupaia chinensis TaxID=246437 RepID=L9L0R2_TUPCH|nr:hypothetical protein TREES_T100008787 [Tupaia chinensis]
MDLQPLKTQNPELLLANKDIHERLQVQPDLGHGSAGHGHGYLVDGIPPGISFPHQAPFVPLKLDLQILEVCCISPTVGARSDPPPSFARSDNAHESTLCADQGLPDPRTCATWV